MAPREGALMTIPNKGMDHELYDFSAMPTRGLMPWPDGARMAITVLLHLEYWELQPPEGSVRDNRFTGEYGFYYPEYRPFTQREYGNRIGIFRVLKALDALTLTSPLLRMQRLWCAIQSWSKRYKAAVVNLSPMVKSKPRCFRLR